MTSPKYTKGKLRVYRCPVDSEMSSDLEILDGNDHCIFQINTHIPDHEANAARLALCWNSFDDLVKALEAALDEMGEEPHLPPCSCGECVTIRQIKQALSAARGEGKAGV